MMVSKYESKGLIAVSGDDVNAPESLVLLEGRLDEAKRMRAIAALAGAEGEATTTAASAPHAPRASSAKVQKDEVELNLKRLDYGERAGELVAVDQVAEASRKAVTVMRETFGNERRTIAKSLCAQFDIPAEKETALARFLGDQFELALGKFGEACKRIVDAPDRIAEIPPEG